MRDFKKELVLIGFCSLSVGCAVTVEDEEFASKQQASHIATKVKVVHSPVGSGNPASALCSGSLPAALSVSGGGDQHEFVKGMYFVQSDGDPVGGIVATQNNATIFAAAVCSDYSFPTRLWTYESDGDATLSCPSNHVAVGGGGSCTSSSGKLNRNRPNPATSGGEPTGWRASCTAGGVWTYANCAPKGGVRDWDDCKVRSGSSGGSYSEKSCSSGELAVAAGSVCNGGSLRGQQVYDNLQGVASNCSSGVATTYAVCCPGVYK